MRAEGGGKSLPKAASISVSPHCLFWVCFLSFQGSAGLDGEVVLYFRGRRQDLSSWYLEQTQVQRRQGVGSKNNYRFLKRQASPGKKRGACGEKTVLYGKLMTKGSKPVRITGGCRMKGRALKGQLAPCPLCGKWHERREISCAWFSARLPFVSSLYFGPESPVLLFCEAGDN